ncbi:uncharacterized protein LOC111264890 isoform X3 [Varroa jacobsoni]|uniref:uncharacterized protein LOC111264890 isoform X3 n=1 Tax=Varroa jacobsoni TaxID=62625 RepID=UPI000BF2FBCB|nr:uncharacterized protein LOC111264890 isoform X3 [Varroa jacobsoni]XP_022696865.1 uncharacterized protein LOC111264890 isoform X3 [Varroa jacobsoni]
MATQIARRDGSHTFLPIVLMKSPTQTPVVTDPESTSVVKEEILSPIPEITFINATDTHEAAAKLAPQPQQIRVMVQIPPERSRSPPSTAPEFCVDTTKAIYPGLHLGATFSSYQDLTNLVAKFQMAKGVHLYVRSSRKLYPALNHMGEVIRDYNHSLIFAEVYYACTRGGRRFARRIGGDAEFRNCPFNIKIRLTRDGKHLYIRDICPAHNHVLERGVVPRPVTHAPQALDDIGQRPRIKIMKPPSILTRHPIIHTLVRGESTSDVNGACSRQVILVPTTSIRSPLTGQMVVPLTVAPAAKPTGPTMTSVSAATPSKTAVVASAIRTHVSTTTVPTDARTRIHAAVTAIQNLAPVRVKEEPKDVDVGNNDCASCEPVYQDTPSQVDDQASYVFKTEATDEVVEQSVFDADTDCVMESEEKIVPDDGESVEDDTANEFSADLDLDDEQTDGSSELAKRPRMTRTLPCPDDRFVMSRQNILDTMKFCCECGTRVSERYYTDKPDRLAVTLVCEEGHTVDWILQKIIRKKIPYQVRLSDFLPMSSVQAVDAVQRMTERR